MKDSSRRPSPRLLLATALTALSGIATTCTISVPTPTPPTTPFADFAGRRMNTVILGDSFASGVANGPYSTTAPAYCMRSPESWGEKLYRTLQTIDHTTGSVTNMSCSGASTQSVQYSQLKAVRTDTDLVLLQVGGNDFGVVSMFIECLLGCDAQQLLARSLGQVREVRSRLVELLSDISAAAPNATIVITDYPDLVGDPSRWNGASCMGVVSPATADALHKLVDVGEQMFRSLARIPHVVYVSQRAALAGHNQCDVGTPWVSGLEHYERDLTKRVLPDLVPLHLMDPAHNATAVAAREALIQYLK